MTANSPLTIIGSGCAGLSLAKALGEKALGDITLVTDKSYQERAPHIWAFWHMPWLDEAAALSSHHWQKWRICNEAISIIHEAADHPYHMLASDRWLAHCHQQSGITETVQQLSDTPASAYFDSRPLPAPKGSLLQHFRGQHITTSTDAFDPTTAILMDFRCDQSQGLHFIYLLPSSARTALIESTFFTQSPHEDGVYETAIASYMAEHYDGISYQITATESGIIPLADCRDKEKPANAIGARGGAFRPSSGYAFSFIQKQVAQILADYQKNKSWQSRPSLSARDRWMDHVFLHVLKHHPQRAVDLFMRLAKALDGREFALFMSGEARLGTIAKIIFAMPKMPFITAACAVILGRSQ